MSFSRRGFCKSVAGMSVISFLGAAKLAEAVSMSPTLQGSGKITLNVYLHGMFAVVFNSADKTVTLLPPHVGGGTPHIYLAGDMQSPPLRLEKDGYYGSDLKGSADTVPAIDPAQNVVINLSDTIKPSGVKPHCTIVLPLPNDFYPLRTVAPQATGQYIFDNPMGLAQQPKAVPLVSLLQYQIPSIGESYYLKYHFFAEPNVCPTEFHTTEAFHQLKQLFSGLDSLKVNSDLGLNDIHEVPEPTPSGQLGVAPEDKFALVEWLGLKCEDPDYPSNSPQNRKPRSPQKLIDSTGRPISARFGGQFGIHPTACMSMIAL